MTGTITSSFDDVRSLKDCPLEFLDGIARTMNDVTELKLGLRPAFLVSHPDLIREVLVEKADVFTKRNIHYRRLRPVVGSGLIANWGPRAHLHRRALQDCLDPRRLCDAELIIKREALSTLGLWAAAKDPIDVSAETARLAIRVIGSIAFDVDLSAQADTIREAFALLSTEFGRWRVASLFPRLPSPSNRRCWNAVAELRNVASSIQNHPSRFVRTQHQYGKGQVQIQDEIITILLAGFETTANLLAWCFLALARHQEQQDQLRRCKDLVQPFVFEVLRLYPPVWILSRAARETVEIGDSVRIPKKAVVFVSPFVTHRRADLWDSPHEFAPSRFSSSSRRASARLSYIPFGAGPRSCIGRELALLEANLAVMLAVERFSFELLPNQSVNPVADLTLRAYPRVILSVNNLDRRPVA